MYLQDDETAFSEPKMRSEVRSSTHGTSQLTTWRPLVTFGQDELESITSGPFYTPPSTPNQRCRPGQKWLLGTGFFIAASCGYLLGINQRPPASPPVQAALPEMPDMPTLPQTAILPSQPDLAALPDMPSLLDMAAMFDGPALPKMDVLPSAVPASLPAPSLETEFVALEGGAYVMGDSLDGLKDARPHQVRLAPFMIARHEVNLKLWTDVMIWGRSHGYTDLPDGSGKAHDHPVCGISWGDAVKWCNALSEKEGLAPCYYTGTTRQNVARKGRVDIGNQHVNWEGTGYRLPTEGEWEFAARGGLANKRFPWGNEIIHEQANYHGSALIEYDKCQHEGAAAILKSSAPYTAVIGSFKANGFGLYDMAGNVAEWCWDFYDPSYGAPMQPLDNPHGPEKGKNCVIRGGSWRHTASDARCASRFSLPGDITAIHVGFRVVRGL
ncbi:SUMF1/EgtB/PvdO family nonheme iron enzyme [Prosthecobacter sp.]|uniref:formylglycine-generating enzyme family protein n=1 Tax=Prosthecobacter sp. TaxID=1965333 RepID=UPI002486CED8|nr:SUMF1/EgtB/PvdO family nonheme iron enzyme [Prosthecobacter sp.]MDI1314156.1 SUMF1/EgtB/PvdO family nonheme iron enzyme [Prosthecobacter sp.]